MMESLILIAAIIAASEPIPYNCSEVKSVVQMIGKEKVVEWAKKAGFSNKQIIKVKRECKV